jgi:hypothetical protein
MASNPLRPFLVDRPPATGRQVVARQDLFDSAGGVARGPNELAADLDVAGQAQAVDRGEWIGGSLVGRNRWTSRVDFVRC